MTDANYYNYYFSSNEIKGSSQRLRARSELIYELIEPLLPLNAPVLELGVGKGLFAETCTTHGHPYHGVEDNSAQCHQLEADGFKVTCGRVPPVPLERGKFGLIYSSHLIEHLPGSHAVHELLTDCQRLLAPGGVLALVFPDIMSMGNHFWNVDYTHAWATTERRVSQVLADSGYSVRAVHKLRGHLRGGRKLLAAAGSRPIVLKAAHTIARNPEKRDIYYRGWLYLQREILLIAAPRSG